jgi:hypothetical protein
MGHKYETVEPRPSKERVVRGVIVTAESVLVAAEDFDWIQRKLERLTRELAATQDRERQLVQSVELRDRELDEVKGKPAHEREMPHCSTCECWKADTVRAAQPPGDGR